MAQVYVCVCSVLCSNWRECASLELSSLQVSVDRGAIFLHVFVVSSSSSPSLPSLHHISHCPYSQTCTIITEKRVLFITSAFVSFGWQILCRSIFSLILHQKQTATTKAMAANLFGFSFIRRQTPERMAEWCCHNRERVAYITHLTTAFIQTN